MSATILYAPNVHTGGGLVLLQGLLAAWPADGPRIAVLDARARELLTVPQGVEVSWTLATPTSRLAGALRLANAARAGDTTLCFHGLPPMIRNRSRVVVYMQNSLLLGLRPLRDYPLRTRARIAFECQVAKRLRHRVAEYIVQTPSMARELTRWYGPGCPPVRMLPFIDKWPIAASAAPAAWDFVYVSDGIATKNHLRLLHAWQLLAAQGMRPSLALTLGPRDATLAARIAVQSRADRLNVVNLGHLPRPEVLKLYGRARALLFPSLSESFGLPLIEAAHLGLPILAPELDYVRDVCSPAQTFDPLSAVSIARAVRRFLGEPEPLVQVSEPQALWAALAEGGRA